MPFPDLAPLGDNGPLVAHWVSADLPRRAAEMGIGKPTFRLDICHEDPDFGCQRPALLRLFVELRYGWAPAILKDSIEPLKD